MFQPRILSALVVLFLLCTGRLVHAQLVAAGGLTWNESTQTGYRAGISLTVTDAVNNRGMAVDYAVKYVGGVDLGPRPVRWDRSGAVELGNLGTSPSGVSNAQAYSINNSGTAVGFADKYTLGGARGHRGVRWDASGTVATELGGLGTNAAGITDIIAYSINNDGTAVGTASKYVGGVDQGHRAVRWDASGTAATELGVLGTESSGYTNAFAYGINEPGTAIGHLTKHVGGLPAGQVAVRWESSGTAATELGNLGINSDGRSQSRPYAINNGGTVVGWSEKYVGTVDLGQRAVRWDASGTAATELGNLGTASNGTAYGIAYSVNESGTAVGVSTKYVGGVDLGSRAVRWDASGTAVTELGNLGTTSAGWTFSGAWAINNKGIAVGYAREYVGGVYQGERATMWLKDGSVVDLNDLRVMPSSGGGTWVLNYATSLTNDGWVSGHGTFDPDGAGALSAYDRLFVTQIGLGGKWENPGGGTWGRGPNWSTNTPAMEIGDATFDLPDSYAVDFDRDEITGKVSINAGTVALNMGGHTLTTVVGLDVAAGAILKGNGHIIGDVHNKGTISPGNSPGVIDITGDFSTTGVELFEIEGTGAGQFDQINVSGEFDAGGVIQVQFLNGFAAVEGDTFQIMSFSSFVDSGYSFDFSLAALASGLTWYTGDFSTTGQVSVVPEPGTWALLGLAGASLWYWRRARRNDVLAGRRVLPVLVAFLLVGTGRTGLAQLVAAGSPTWDQTTGTGFRNAWISFNSGVGVNNSGTGVGYATLATGGISQGERPVRWDDSGTATELGTLGANGTYAAGQAVAINDGGTTVGYSEKYVGGVFQGTRAVRWDASGTVPTELANLGVDASGVAYSQALAINNTGTVAGVSQKFESGFNRGSRPVRWDASGTPTELGVLGTGALAYGSVYAINDANTAVGHSSKFEGGVNLGPRAVRWDGSGTAATELGNLGTAADGTASSNAYAVNGAGISVGFAQKYVGGVFLGDRALRWDAGTGTAELASLGTDGSGYAFSVAYAINTSGTAVGSSQKFTGGSDQGLRAVRWDGSGTAVTELGNLGTSSSGFTYGEALAVNDAGSSVGYIVKYTAGVFQGERAVFWLPDTSAIDLNDLGVMPASGGGIWQLNYATVISADGWVAGVGTFDPDGAGALSSYSRLFVTQVGLGGEWTNAAGGTWGRGANWSTGTPAMQVGDATFSLASAYAIHFDRDERTRSVSIEAGTVTLNLGPHTLTVENGLSIAAGATLAGSGTIIGDVENAGTISPGNSPGVLNIVGDFSTTGVELFEIEGTGAGQFDQINVSGEFDAGGVLQVQFLNGFSAADGDTFQIMSFGSFVDSGYTFDFTLAALASGLAWDTSDFATTGVISVTAVPEPSTWAMLGLAGAGVWYWRRARVRPETATT